MYAFFTSHRTKKLVFMSVIFGIAFGVVYASFLDPLLHKTAQPVMNSVSNTILVPTQTRQDPATKEWSYVFADYADGALPTGEWHFEEGTTVANYNNEAQAYTSRPSNVRIEDGLLVIEAKKEGYAEKQYTSARISTHGNFSFTYGTLEVDMMLPRGKGTWPAAWLMPRHAIYQPENYGISKNDKLSWVLNGEIDFAEAIGRLPGQNIPAAHSYNELQAKPIYTPAYIRDPYTTFHRYGIIKTPEKITFTLDGRPYATREKNSNSPLDWPFDQPYYLILNLAIGGDWAGAEGIDDTLAPWQLKVKSISYKPL